jgi:hypothetical protein
MTRRVLAATLLACAVLCPVHAADPTEPTQATAIADCLTAGERAAIDALAEQLVAAGIPETRGASIVVGNVVVSEPAPAAVPADDADHRTQRRVRVNEDITDGKRIRTYQGTHLQLADGRWLLGLQQLVATTAERSITPAADATRMTPGELPAHLKDMGEQRNRFSRMDDWLQVFTTADRPRLEAALAAATPLYNLDGQWATGITLLLLHRAGVPGADAQLLLTGLSSVWPQAMRWSDVAPPILLQEGSRDIWQRWQRQAFGAQKGELDHEQWMRDHVGAFAIPDPIPMLHQHIAGWYRSLFDDPEAMTAFGLDAQHAAAQVLAFTRPERRARLTPELDLLVARLALPAQAPADADLATRLQFWQPASGRDGDDGDTLPDADQLAQLPAEIQAHFRTLLAKRAGWKPSASDAPALLDLLSDSRPSRWIDYQSPRTVGDNALRALTSIVGFDPRLLIGRDTAAPWTADERQATAEGLRAWWRTLGSTPLGEGLLAAIDSLPLGAVTRLIASRPADARGALFDRVAASWQGKAQPTVEAQDLAAFLTLAGDNAAIATQVGAWPVAGPLRPLLAVWHDRHGRPAPLDTLLDELVAAGNGDDAAASILTTALQQAMRQPSPTRLQRCMALAAGPIDDRRTWAVLCATGDFGGYGTADPAWQAVATQMQAERSVTMMEGNDRVDAAYAIPLVIVCTMLADVRPIPSALMHVEAYGEWGQLSLCGSNFGVQMPATAENTQAEAKPTPPELRVRDLAAIASQSMIWRIGLHELGQVRLDPWAAVAVRDTGIGRLHDAFLERARSAIADHKLPDVLPAAPPTDGDKALF